MTVSQISEWLSTQDEVPFEIITRLQQDARKSVINLLHKWQQRQDHIAADKARIGQLYLHERSLTALGYQHIAGIDEAGRGPLAGPVVVASVVLPVDCYLPQLNDSKQVSASQREALYGLIKEKAIAIQSVVIGAEMIDQLNIYEATRMGMYQAVSHLTIQPDYVLVDAMPLPKLTMPHLSLIHGDALSASIAAASIVAKVERDHLMDEWNEKFPVYGFAKHKGYGTKEHIQAIKQYGICDIHRRSFEPIKSMEGYDR